MKKIRLNKGKCALVSDEDYERVNKYKWYLHSAGYAISQEYSKRTYKTRYMHRFIMNPPKGFQVDHKNRNKLDNRRSNLRVCTPKQNMNWLYDFYERKGLRKGYTLDRSKCKGVYWDKSVKRWKAEIRHNGKRYRLGNHKFRKDALAAYQTWAVQNI
jgi:hypothetical protein